MAVLWVGIPTGINKASKTAETFEVLIKTGHTVE